MNLGQKLKNGWNELSTAIEDCSEGASEEAVHHLRTRSRRLEALAGALLTTHGEGNDELASAGRSLLRRLKRVRRRAGSVRDLDIYLKLLELFSGSRSGDGRDEAAKLERALKRKRKKAAIGIVNWIKRQRCGLDRRAKEFLRCCDVLPESGQQMDTFALATTGFLEASAAIPELRASNLHEFRKRLKMSRYIAEANPRSPQSVKLAKKLVGVQDAIGAWHDWDALMLEAQDRLGHKRADLLPQIATRRAVAYRAAMRIAQQTRQQILRRAS